MQKKRRPSKTFQQVEREALAVDEALGRLDAATLQRLKGIWLRATVDERRQFKQWATRRERRR